jgi:hypothetical protein
MGDVIDIEANLPHYRIKYQPKGGQLRVHVLPVSNVDDWCRLMRSAIDKASEDWKGHEFPVPPEVLVAIVEGWQKLVAFEAEWDSHLGETD